MSGSYYPGDILLFRGLGKGQYAVGEKLHLADGKLAHAGLASAVALADWNRDGKIDLIVGNIAGEVWFLPNESHDHKLLFGSKRRLEAAGGEIEVDGDAGPLVADWDGDGIPDLLVGAADGSVTWYRGSGTTGAPKLGAGMTLVPALPNNNGEAIRCEKDPKTGLVVLPQLDRPSIRPKLAVYDWNGDGKLDLIVGDAMTTLGPEPVLTDEQKKERDALDKQHQAIGNEISKRFSDAETRAREELGGSNSDVDEDDLQERIHEKASEALSKTDEYRQLHVRADELWKKLRPLKADNSMHGFVWVYLRTRDAKTADAGDSQPASAPAASEAVLVVRVVTKETGEPFRSVRVNVEPKVLEDFSWKDTNKSRGTMHESLRPSEQGIVEFTVPPGQELELRASDATDNTLRSGADVLALPPGVRYEVKLEIATQPDLEFYGRVVGGPGGAVIAGARVRAIRASGHWVSSGNEPAVQEWTTANLAEVSSGSDGSFHIGIETWKRPHLRVGARGYADRIVVPKPGHETLDKIQTIELSPQATLSATVLDASGTPMRGITVELSAPGYELLHCEEDERIFGGEYFELPEEKWRGESGPDGRCSISALPSGVEMRLEIRRGGEVLRREPDAFKFEPEQTREAEWRIGSGCTLNVIALDQDGKPATGETILMEKAEGWAGYFEPYTDRQLVAQAATDEAGRLSFKDVSAGKWLLGPAPCREPSDSPLESALAPQPQGVEIGDEKSQEVVLHVYRGLSIRGAVVGPDGSRVSEAFISARKTDSSLVSWAQAGKDGSFTLGPLGPGPFTLIASDVGVFAPSEPVLAEVGRTEVVLRVRAGGGIRGTIVDALSGSSLDAQLYVMPEQPQRDGFDDDVGYDTNIKDDGKFEELGLIPGRYGLAAQARDGRFGVLPSVVIAANQTLDSLTIRVTPGGRLRLRYEGSGSGLFATITSQGVPVGFIDVVKSGTTLDKRVPSGPIVIQIRKDPKGDPKLKKIDLAAGETKDVVLRDDD